MSQHDRLKSARQSGGLLLRGTRTHASRKRPSAKRQREAWRNESRVRE